MNWIYYYYLFVFMLLNCVPRWLSGSPIFASFVPHEDREIIMLSRLHRDRVGCSHSVIWSWLQLHRETYKCSWRGGTQEPLIIREPYLATAIFSSQQAAVTRVINGELCLAEASNSNKTIKLCSSTARIDTIKVCLPGQSQLELSRGRQHEKWHDS